MLSLHTVYVVNLISQTTSALVLWLLAAGDRRSRGIVHLASACTLHSAAILLMPLWRGSNRWAPEALSAAILPVMFYLIHQGLARLMEGHHVFSRAGLAAVAAFAALASTVAPWSRLWSLQLASLAAIAVIAQTVRMLWRPRIEALALPARLSAFALLVILTAFVLRLPLEPRSGVSPTMILLREVTMTGITLLAFSFLALYLAETKWRHLEETRRDALTGLLNRRAMEETATRHVRDAGHSGQPLALLMMDLDAFKLLNDTWGHVVGDRALQAVGKILNLTARHPGNTVARLGGEEFAVLLPACPLPEAKKLAELFRSAVSSISLPATGSLVNLTVSIGVATCHPGETSWTDMLHRADVALYRAKRAGRNRVLVCDTLEAAESRQEAHSGDTGTRRQRSSVVTEPGSTPSKAGARQVSSV